MSEQADSTSTFSRTKLKLAFASIGVVFGDVGTSPIYTMREALRPVVAASGDLRLAVLGVVSLLLWALFIIVTLKYVSMLMRADNRGEGGILSLVVLVETLLKRKGGIILGLGIVGAAFFFGDAMITPAMTVLSAIEGLSIINSGFRPFVVPMTVAVILTLFTFQYKGTAGVASIFAPVTMIWFITLAIMGLIHISDDLEVFQALNPIYGFAACVLHNCAKRSISAPSRSETAQYCIDPSAQCRTLKPLLALRTGSVVASLGQTKRSIMWRSRA